MTVQDKRLKEFFHRLGYKTLTPIQEQAIPAIIKGNDVLAMARTGSGKTMAFLYPIMERLGKMTFDTKGTRALIIVPNRELAQQVHNVSLKILKKTSIRSLVLVGGENIESQFLSLASNPDIIICTPGRMWQLLVDTKRISLKLLQILVLDEADKLLEDKTLWQQTQDIIKQLSSTIQKCLFSATLPRKLEEFTSLHLVNPVSIKMDNDVTLSPHLKMTFFHLRSELKDAFLLNMLKYQLTKGSKTIIYTSTKHHVEYLKALLEKAGLNVCYLYGDMDHAFRKTMMQRFRSASPLSSLDPSNSRFNSNPSPNSFSNIMIVTDVASRGLDIEFLENVINYDFTGEPKIFVHRVGRVARQNNSGTAYSFITPSDLPYLYDLSQMLNFDSQKEKGKSKVRKLRENQGNEIEENDENQEKNENDENKIIWTQIKDSSLTDDIDHIQGILRNHDSVDDLRNIKDKAYKLYCKTRPKPTKEALKNIKGIKGIENENGMNDNSILNLFTEKMSRSKESRMKLKEKSSIMSNSDNKSNNNNNNRKNQKKVVDTFKLSYTRKT